MSLRPHPYHTYSLRARQRAANIETPLARSRSLSREASLSSDLPQVWEAFNFGRPHPQEKPLESPSAGDSSSKAGPSASLPPPPGDLPQPPRYTKGEVLLDTAVVAQYEQVRLSHVALVYASHRLQGAALSESGDEEKEWPGILTLPTDSLQAVQESPHTEAAQNALVDLHTAIASYEKVSSILRCSGCSDRCSDRLPSEDCII